MSFHSGTLLYSFCSDGGRGHFLTLSHFIPVHLYHPPKPLESFESVAQEVAASDAEGKIVEIIFTTRSCPNQIEGDRET